MLNKLEQHEQRKLLSFEIAVILGKVRIMIASQLLFSTDREQLGRHRDALRTLVLELHDSASAEAYCTLAGMVISPKIAQSLGERFRLQPWAALVAPSANKAPVATQPSILEREKTVDDRLKKELTGILLEVYMSGG